eukprot:344807-Hanusia_phi.AAC.16
MSQMFIPFNVIHAVVPQLGWQRGTRKNIFIGLKQTTIMMHLTHTMSYLCSTQTTTAAVVAAAFIPQSPACPCPHPNTYSLLLPLAFLFSSSR